MHAILPLLDEVVYFRYIQKKLRKVSLEIWCGLLRRQSVQLCRNSEAWIFRFLWKVGTFLPNYTSLQLRKSYGTQHWLHKSLKFKYILAALRGADMPPLYRLRHSCVAGGVNGLISSNRSADPQQDVRPSTAPTPITLLGSPVRIWNSDTITFVFSGPASFL